MSLRWYATVVQCEDIAAQSRFWAEVLDWRIGYEAPDEVVLVPPHALTKADIIPVEERAGLAPSTRPKASRCRTGCTDLAPRATDDQAAEVARLESLGAIRIDVGQSVEAS